MIHAAPPEKLELQKGEHIAIIGNALAERMLHDGTFEAFIHKSAPDADISIRNLGFSADEITSHMRSDAVPPPNDWLEKAGADVVLAFWGFNEAFKGDEGLGKFKTDLDAYLKDLKSKKFNGVSAPRVVLFSPIAQEKGTDPNWPDPEQNNPNIEKYTAVMLDVAKANDVQFVDLYTPSVSMFTKTEKPLTHNGIHLTTDGYHELAPIIYQALFKAAPPADDALLEKIRAAVVVKNEMWLSRYRTVDQFNIFGGRSTIGYKSANTDGKDRDNRYVIWPELAVRDVMTQNRENRVWALAKGGDLKIDDSNVPPVPVIGTNKPGTNPDGSYTYLDPKEAIRHMTVPKGVKIELVASEKEFPELVSPVQMAWDTKGRLWVSAWKNYPERTPSSKEGDKLLVFDIGEDGKATKCTTFFDDLNCPTGFQFYKDGVFVMKSPELLYLKDTDGDGKGEVIEHVLNGMDAADSHHETNSMAIEPGGAIYLSDGIFHRTQVETAQGPVRNMNGGIFRWEPRTGKFERYIAYGFANPHGKVFDYWGNDIVTDATGNANYFAPAFSGHIDFPGTHPGMNEFWERPSRPTPGTHLLSSRAWPKEYQGNFLNCNVISLQGIFRAAITEDGSGLHGETLENLISSDDPNFRPSGISVAPDGSLYFMDWHKPLIGHLQHHLRDPNREQDHGRIYRLTYEGMPLLKKEKIDGEPIPALLELLKIPENNVRERAKIELGKHDTKEVIAAVDKWLAALDTKDAQYEHNRLEALWVKQYHNIADPVLLKQVLISPEPRARTQAVRVLCYQRDRFPDVIALLKKAAADENPRVRLEAIRALSFFRQWEAADAALAALAFPKDYYIDYCMKETMRQLEQWWKPAIAEGKAIAQGNPAGIEYILEKISTQDLVKLPKSAVVYTVLLTRKDVPEANRLAALKSLSAESKTTPIQIILETLNSPTVTEKAANELCHILLTQPVSDLKNELPAITRLASNNKLATGTRASATAAMLVAKGSITEALASAKSAQEISNMLMAIPLVPDQKLRATTSAPVMAMVKKLPAELVAQAEKSDLNARYIRISLPGKATLALAEVEVISGGKNIARSGKATQSSTGNGADASRAIDGNTSGDFNDGGQTHTQEGQENTWWELDLGSAQPIDSIRIWNRSENNGQFAKRLDHFTLTLLDSEHKEVTSVKDQPAPEVNVEIAIKGDALGDIRRAGIAALPSTGANPEDIFNVLTGLIASGAEVPAATFAIGKLPRTSWKPGAAAPALKAILVWAGGIPVADRTGPSFTETTKLATELAGVLPADQADAFRKNIIALSVPVHVINTVREQMRYDTAKIVVTAGKPFQIVFENKDMMPHNILFVKPGTRQAVAEEVQTMKPDKLDSEGRAYVPGDGKTLDPRVIAASPLVELGKKHILNITAPTEPGNYEYVCTFPGHWTIMWGTLVVEKDPNAAATSAVEKAPAPLTYEGTEGALKGKHIVFIASDHEYKSEEALPALARILAKHHGAKCTVLFGLDPKTGEIKPGESNIPGTEALADADLMVIFTRFQNLPAEQMQPIVDYLARGGPVIGLRTATHGFQIPKDSKFAKYDFQYAGADFKNGFGRQILGETWVGHYGPNHKSSTRLDIVPTAAKSPILSGVKNMWAEIGAYNAFPIEGSEILAMAQPLTGMKPDSPDDKTKKPMPGAWTRTYKSESGKEGRVFTSTYGASGDLMNEGFRRMIVNATFWALGEEQSIRPDRNISLLGKFRPTWLGGTKRSAHVKPQDLAGYDSPIWSEN